MHNKAAMAVSRDLLRVWSNSNRLLPTTTAFFSASGRTKTTGLGREAHTGYCNCTGYCNPMGHATALGYSTSSGNSTPHHINARWLPPLCGGYQQLPVPSFAPCSTLTAHIKATPVTATPDTVAYDGRDAVVNKHLDLTARQTRHDFVASGEVVRCWQPSSWVKCFDIRVEHSDFRFKAGQWVDAFIPGLEVVGGFSICSAPHQLEESRIITLGIKRAEWPPAKWFFNECRVGSVVGLRVGGDFFLDYPSMRDREMVSSSVLLVGGGVGINPLAAMFRHAAHHRERKRRVTLLYSARTEQDLLYKEELDALCREGRELSVDYFTTRTLPSSLSDNMHSARIAEATLAQALSRLSDDDTADTVGNSRLICSPATTTNTHSFTEPLHAAGGSGKHHASGWASEKASAASSLQYDNSGSAPPDSSGVEVFVCGPPAMITAVEQHLLNLGLGQEQIRYEKWW